MMFDEIKQNITARQAAEFYGVHINRQGKAECLWHSPDKDPSLSFKKNYCYCFVCGKGGSSIDITAALFGLSPLEAAKKLNEDFRLGLSAAPSPPPVIQERQRQRSIEAAFDKWIDNSINTMAEYYRLLQTARLEPNADDPLFAESLQESCTVEYYLEFLRQAGTEDKALFYKHNREAIKEYDKRIQRINSNLGQ